MTLIRPHSYFAPAAACGENSAAPLGRLSVLPHELLVDHILLPLAHQDRLFLPGYSQTCSTAYRQTCDLAERIVTSEVTRMRRNNPILAQPDTLPLKTPVFPTPLVHRAQAFIRRATPRPPLEHAQRFEDFLQALNPHQREYHAATRTALWEAAVVDAPKDMVAWEGYFKSLNHFAPIIEAFERLEKVELPLGVLIAPSIYQRVASAHWNNQDMMLSLHNFIPTLRVLLQGRQKYPNHRTISGALRTYFTLSIQWAQSFERQNMELHFDDYVEFLLTLDAVADEMNDGSAMVGLLITRFCADFENFLPDAAMTHEAPALNLGADNRLRSTLQRYRARLETGT